jgi:2-phosphosulfolactate phosphatase
MKLASYSTQSAYAVRCEWGAEAIRYLAPECDAIVIVDVLSFSTCVDVAVSRGAAILPHAFRDERAADYAREKGALLASHERAAPGGYSVSPASLTRIDTGTRLVLPSPNGATLSLLAAETGLPTFAGCLRNAGAVAAAASRHGERVLVVPGAEPILQRSSMLWRASARPRPPLPSKPSSTRAATCRPCYVSAPQAES